MAHVGVPLAENMSEMAFMKAGLQVSLQSFRAKLIDTSSLKADTGELLLLWSDLGEKKEVLGSDMDSTDYRKMEAEYQQLALHAQSSTLMDKCSSLHAQNDAMAQKTEDL
ncbi:hypothetical protein NDU88_002526 [Pleurodeles waltl]|uniref:Uncharacterized protein n=1 Tax=Pleurodeles waltl TaxID=8319 RepID=A0AAV7UVW3_PLEWA|nr:hypothetical protein NDU88_002526 [Pleurodeles waltl]